MGSAGPMKRKRRRDATPRPADYNYLATYHFYLNQCITIQNFSGIPENGLTQPFSA